MTYQEKAQLYQRVFSGKDGEDILEDLATQCFVHRSTYPLNTQNARDISLMNEGCRSVYLYIKQWIDADPNKIPPTQQEGE